MGGKSSSFELLHESVQRWVWRQGWISLRDIQENSIPIVLRRDSDMIISAATAGGKTEAAFLPILSHILAEPSDGYSVLYVSPLKALINDQYKRLADMVAGTTVEVTSWHGDIDASRKARSLKSPQGILIITPESLESFLINRNSSVKKAFGKLKYVVIDELHAFIGNERGKQLQSLLSRIELITDNKTPRIAMSATFSSYDKVKKFLRHDESYPCEIPNQGYSNHETKVLVKEFILERGNVTESIAKEIFSKLRGSNNLAFVNRRVDAESYAVMLGDMCEEANVPNEFRVHHGSLSKEERESVEQELQKGAYPVTALCTSTLELGVDIGKVKSIAQIGVANSVSGLRQRLGRSGRRDEPSELRVFSIENEESQGVLYDLRANMIQNIAVVELLREKAYEEPVVNKTHLSTLIQQILSLVASYGGFYPKEGWEILCGRGAFRNITPKVFLALLKSLGSHGLLSQLDTGQIIVGKEGERILRRLDFYTAFVAPAEYNVINTADSKDVGTLQTIPQENQALILAGRRWIVDSVDERSRNVYVSQIKSGGSIAFASEVPEIDGIITRKMREIYMSGIEYPYVDAASGSDLELMGAREFFYRNKLDMNFFIGKTLFTWAGAKVNRTIVLMCKLRLQKYPDYNHLFIGGISPADIARILSLPKPSGEELAALVPRSSKEKQKYDNYLSDELMNIDYANTWLDIDKAWEVLECMATAGGYEEISDVAKPKDKKNKMVVYDFRHIKDIANVIRYETLTSDLHEKFYNCLKNIDLDCNIDEGAMFPGAPEHAMPVNFMLTKGDKKVAVLLVERSKIKRYSVQETEALCRENGVVVMRFYFEYNNEEGYIEERIRKAFD